ncbi:phosphoadenosine phosphosulfate reductase family protein [Patescibacteria group bacterium]|nr:phosphoadenosine phosphosulfate reductase family protein [Patescibacteria group bacterium]
MTSNGTQNVEPQKCRHILSLSGGKDSTALALYLKDRVPDMEYAFCDTGEELSETYDYLLKIEAVLGRKVTRLNPDRPFRHYLDLYRGVLPDPRTRWCTRMLKLRPFERYVGDDPVYLYVGIRGDEPHRKGYVSTKPNIKPQFPFVEDGIKKRDVLRILEDSGLGMPDYYKWRSRSGCYFCFFQQRREWIGLLERHSDLYWKAAAFEKYDEVTRKLFTWIENESLHDLAKPERAAEINAEYQRKLQKHNHLSPGASLRDVFEVESEEQKEGCLVCHL